MTVKEIAKEWECKENWVRDRCKEKMIPLAEKKRFVWDIPSDAEKPPCTRHYAVNLLNVIMESMKGVNINFFPGKNHEKIMDVYKYLSEWAYISKIDCSNKESIELSLKKVTITERGIELINLTKENMYDNEKTRMKAAVNVGAISMSYDTTKVRKGKKDDHTMENI